ADPYSWVSISKDGQIHGVGLTDATGYLNLEFDPFTEPGYADIVATRSQRRPLISTINVIPNEGPYVTVSPITINDDNGTAEAGEAIDIDLSFSNVGILAAENLTVSISTESPWIYIPQNVAVIDDISPDGSITVPSIFSIMIDQGTPDQHEAELTITVSDGDHEWVSERSITVNAPNVIISSVAYFDPNNNGIFEAGESINITLNITNNGHMSAQSGTLNLILNSDLASLPLSSFVIPGINVDGNIPLTFNLNISEEAELGTTIALGVALDMGVQMINQGLIIPVGAVMEGFETGDFSSFAWQNNSANPWTVVNTQHNSGTYSAKSGTIGNNTNTDLSITVDVLSEGDISFYRKVSSESSYDKLMFYIDGEEKGNWSGTVDWSQVSYAVEPGTRTFKWSYVKDVSMTGGSDSAWIDDIRFPSSGSSELAMAYTTTQSIDFEEVFPNTSYSEDLILRNLGTADLSGVITLPAAFTLVYNGQNLPNDYFYIISPGATRTFNIALETGSSVSTINEVLVVTTNDPDLAEIQIPITVEPSSNGIQVNPVVTALNGNFPNPFNPETTINFSLKEAGNVKLNIFNIKGQLIRTLVNAPMNAGKHQMVWNGKDNNGTSVSSGLYLYRMEAGSYRSTKKMMLMK
ncbi:MAG: FlgD immunoglobulin-like domain containing protein, partial [Candidatus Cloacimonetes bacterium]|nr:FlgD immunoglobulin-like domain containing protein [Candidatus Cloacimonadota bacterium]